jgi:hypothetical protein
MPFTRRPNPRPGSYRFAEPLHGVQSAFGAFKGQGSKRFPVCFFDVRLTEDFVQ